MNHSGCGAEERTEDPPARRAIHCSATNHGSARGEPVDEVIGRLGAEYLANEGEMAITARRRSRVPRRALYPSVPASEIPPEEDCSQAWQAGTRRGAPYWANDAPLDLA
jgi:hypothetical protein